MKAPVYLSGFLLQRLTRAIDKDYETLTNTLLSSPSSNKTDHGNKRIMNLTLDKIMKDQNELFLALGSRLAQVVLAEEDQRPTVVAMDKT